MKNWLEDRLEEGDLNEWEVQRLVDGEMSGALGADALEYQERRKKMPADVRNRDDARLPTLRSE